MLAREDPGKATATTPVNGYAIRKLVRSSARAEVPTAIASRQAKSATNEARSHPRARFGTAAPPTASLRARDELLDSGTAGKSIMLETRLELTPRPDTT